MPAAETATPSSEPLALNGKRKRDDDLNSSTLTDGINGIDAFNNHSAEETKIGNQIRDICEALQKYDTTPSVLSKSLRSDAGNETHAPASKRAKLSSPEKHTDTILQRAESNTYASVEEFIGDVEQATEQVQASLAPQQNDTSATQWRYQPDSLEADRVFAQLKAFKKLLRAFIIQTQRQSDAPPLSTREDKIMTNGVVKAEDNASSHLGEDSTGGQGKAVLTLFGNAQGQHKQLFSSFQKPLPRHLWSTAHTSAHSSSDALMPLRENGLLGNQIISTKLVPAEARDALPASKADLRFRDLFQPPSSLPALTPPKPTSSSTSRGANITWSTDSASTEPSQRHGYTTEKLPTSQWLGYDGISTEQEIASPEAKRRRRDRALSSGEATREQPEQMKAALAKAKEDALFRRVYSSFAPTVDNSASLIPEETKNDLWWASYAGSYIDPSFAVDPQLDESAITDEVDAIDADPDGFKDVIENFEPVNLEVSEGQQLADGEPAKILLDISELLETLQSHQRVRNSHLGGAARMGGSQTSSLSSGTGPNEAESSIYNKSRIRLADLVSRLPPYTLAKAGGDQLADLILSRDILLEGRNYQGTMDDDQATRFTAAAAINSNLATSSATRNATVNRPASFNHGRTNSGQVAPATPSNVTRSASNTSKPPLSSWQTPAQSYAASAPRPAYNQLNNYGRTPLNSYTNSRPLAAQQPSGVGTGYQQTPTQPMYQQRAQNTPGQYGGYNQSSTTPRPPSSNQAGYQPIMSRPPSNGYSSATATAPAPQAPMSGGTQLQPRPAQSPLPQGSPYAPPQANMNTNNNSPRPLTPATPALLAQVQQTQQSRQSPSLAPVPSQAMTTSSSNGTPAPAGT